jgi:arylsulfatase
VLPWDELSPNEQKFACRLQEAYAAFMDHTDHEIGRLVAFLEEIGELDNTLFLVLTDNGASQEGGARGVLDEMKFFQGIEEDVDEVAAHLDIVGGPHSHPNYPWGWAMVGNTPFKRYKQNVHWGGVRAPFIVHWPAQIDDRGAVRTQFHNVIDLLPTVLDVCGVACAGRGRRCRADAIARNVAALRVRGAVGTFDAFDASTSRCMGIGRSTTTAGRQ